MYRLLSASQDAYIQNKYIKGVRCTDANTGQAGTLDLYSLYAETYVPTSNTGSIVSGVMIYNTGTYDPVREVSRLLIKFDYSQLTSLTSSVLDMNDSSFKAYMSMKDIYGGQTVPSNYTVEIIPLAKDWNEGRGSDVISYRQLDVCNFLTASVVNSTYVTWSLEGANASGSLTDGTDVDVWVSGNIGSGNQSLKTSQFFRRGDEDLWVDITQLVSASVAGILPNNGFRVSYTAQEENSDTTYFVKRFGTRHAYNDDLKPKLHIRYSGERIEDQTALSNFSSAPQTFYIYNKNDYGNYANFTSGSSVVSGANCLTLELAASHSVEYFTQSWSISHSASITHKTRSLDVFTASFIGSQHVIGENSQTGIYKSTFVIDPDMTSSLKAFLSGASSHEFKVSWKSLDSSITYAALYETFEYRFGTFSNVTDRNIVANITNLRQEYQSGDQVRLRVFVQNYDADMKAYKTYTQSQSVIIPNMYWRLRKAYENIEVIPYHEDATRLSFDHEGMFFDIWPGDLEVNIVYQIDFLIRSDSTGKDTYIENPGFRFKVVE